ncbi:MAG: flagellar biosynthesis protein FlhB [Nitrospirae bacterium]|nr:flagellar biosynthesis protein FlhB [Nitrospirota bacterium]
MPEFDERTEKATPRRRQKAREKGQVVRSHEVISISAMAGIILIFYFAGDVFIRSLSEMMGSLLGLQYGRDPVTVLRFTFFEMPRLFGPFLGVVFVFAITGGVIQGSFVTKPLELDIERFNPLNGLKRIFSLSGLMNFLKSLCKFVFGGIFFYCIFKNTLLFLPSLSSMDIRQIQLVSAKIVAKSVLYAFGLFLVFAILDFIIEKWRYERSIRMTKAEIKEEHRETEGDPLIKAKIRGLQREMAKLRMMQEVPKATVVITNPTHIAVALRYKSKEMEAPKVIAKGAGYIAEKIILIAREHGIPIVEDKPLARALYKLKIDSFIPEELYRAVAKILAYIYKVRGSI